MSARAGEAQGIEINAQMMSATVVRLQRLRIRTSFGFAGSPGRVHLNPIQFRIAFQLFNTWGVAEAIVLPEGQHSWPGLPVPGDPAPASLEIPLKKQAKSRPKQWPVRIDLD
jgi:hypothetical protein